MKISDRLKKVKDSSILYWILYVLTLYVFYLLYSPNSFVHYYLRKLEISLKFALLFAGYIIFTILGRFIFHIGWQKLSNPKAFKFINVVADYILIAEIFVILYSLAFLINKFYNIFDLDLVLNLFHIIYCIWIFISIVKNIMDYNYFEIVKVVSLFFVLGFISLSKWTMIAAVINIFTFWLDYDKYITLKKYLKRHKGLSEMEDEKEVKEKLTLMKLDSLFITVFIYVFILITDHIDISGWLYMYFSNLESLPHLIAILFKGLDKFVLGLIIFVIYKKILQKYKKYYKDEFIGFILDKIVEYKV